MYRDKQDEFEADLARIIINSADVLPQEVAEYLRVIARRVRDEEVSQALREYRCLVDHIPQDYAAFVRSVLVIPDRDYDDYGMWDTVNCLGIRDQHVFFPESHLSGPFLYLLRHQECVALQLIHDLSNHATAQWVARERSVAAAAYIGHTPRTPLPIRVDWPTGSKEYWGNDQVYCWFRPNSVGPYPVKSALMALEFWVDEQLAANRNPVELFHAIQEGSECAAVLGILVGASLRRPAHCLSAVLPLASCPLIWRLDIARFVADSQGSFYFAHLGHNKHLIAARKEIDQWPQRKADIRSLALVYLMSKDESIRTRFQTAVSAFRGSLPLCFAEEQDDSATVAYWQDLIDRWLAAADPANYTVKQVGNELHVQHVIPVHIRERDQVQSVQNNRMDQMLGLLMWARKTLDEGTPAPTLSWEDAYKVTRAIWEVLSSEDNSAFGELRHVAAQAVASAAAALLVADYEMAHSSGAFQWCRGILLEIGVMPYGSFSHVNAIQQYSSEPRVSAAIGLTAILAKGLIDSEIRRTVIRLVGDPQHQVISAVLSRLRSRWTEDEVLCTNAFALGLARCVEPKRRPRGDGYSEDEWERKWVESLVEQSLDNLESNTVSPLGRIRVSAKEYFMWDIAPHVLVALPASQCSLDSRRRQEVLDIVDDLLTWTISNCSPAVEERLDYIPYEWVGFLPEWMASLVRMFTESEAERHLLKPIVEQFASFPALASHFMRGFIKHAFHREEMPASVENQWRYCATAVISRSRISVGKAHRRRITRDRECDEALSLTVFCSHGYSLFNERWPHAQRFESIIDDWVGKFAHEPYLFRCLLTFLQEPGRQFLPEPALTWLSTATSHSADSTELFKETGNGTLLAECLLDVLRKHGPEIRGLNTSLYRLSHLVDILVDAGIPTAAALRRQLEEP